MIRRLVCISVLVFIAVSPAAAADGFGPVPGLLDGWTGVTAPGQKFRYVTFSAGSRTVVAKVRRSTGRVWQWRPLAGNWGVPLVANDGTAGGLTRDGHTLVLGAWASRISPHRSSRFLVLSTQTFRVWRRIVLHGDFVFDALSPGGRYVYLIEHVSSADLTRYRVRAYDLATRRLLRRVIADRRQASWTMQGYPVTRAEDVAGRFVYTLYQSPDGTPFVHALDAASRTATCVGIPWRGVRDIVPSLKLRLDSRERTLTIETARGRQLFAIDTRTYWVSRPHARKGWLPISALLR